MAPHGYVVYLVSYKLFRFEHSALRQMHLPLEFFGGRESLIVKSPIQKSLIQKSPIQKSPIQMSLT